MRDASPTPVDRVEAADGLPLRATVAVVGYAETVGLVAQMLDNAQGLGILVDIERNAVAGKIDFFETFGNADNGDGAVEADLVECLYGCAELPFAAVDDYELGQVDAFFHEACVAACQDLFHRGEVVGSDDGLDVEMAVLLARGAAVAEDHARGDGVRSLQVRVVETLDVARLPRQPQLLLHGVHQPFGMAFGILDLHVF